MLMQICTLIFGFMRNKKVKLLSTFEQRIKTDTSRPHYDAADDDDISSHSMSTHSKTSRNSDNSWFDPPLENYRFYYQGEVNDSKDR